MFGSNSFGQLGFPNNLNYLEPTLLDFPKKIIGISCGYNHTFILTIGYHLYSFGLNDKGQLGLEDYINRSEPTYVLTNIYIKQINHTFIPLIWQPLTHQWFSPTDQDRVYLFILILSRFKVLLPKPIRSKIINLFFQDLER
jgi:alpha-tubulin suppressor-like RCC1 family protein